MKGSKRIDLGRGPGSVELEQDGDKRRITFRHDAGGVGFAVTLPAIEVFVLGLAFIDSATVEGMRIPGMREISGFGGTYEEACWSMLRAGVEWFNAHPEADPRFKGYAGVMGLVEENDDARQLTKVLDEAAKLVGTGDGPTGAMHQVVIEHLLFIKRNGWLAFVHQMTRPEAPPRPPKGRAPRGGAA